MSLSRLAGNLPEQYSNDDVLGPKQIEQLLQEAEIRLKAKADLTTQTSSRPEDQDVLQINTPITKIQLPKLTNGLARKAYIEKKLDVAQVDGRRLLSDKSRKMANTPKEVPAGSLHIKAPQKADKPTAGPEWFDIPKTTLTTQLKRDLQLIEMRSVLDPHRHYKKTSGKNNVPAFSQVGTVIEGPTEWYSARINKKERTKNFVEDALAGEQVNGRFKRKYGEIQDKKTSGKKAHYKSLMEKRKRRK